jgi:hypothetical protein
MLLDFLQGQWRVLDDLARQEDYPSCWYRQPSPEIACLIVLKGWHGPAQGGFEEVLTRLDRPAGVACAPDSARPYSFICIPNLLSVHGKPPNHRSGHCYLQPLLEV